MLRFVLSILVALFLSACDHPSDTNSIQNGAITLHHIAHNGFDLDNLNGVASSPKRSEYNREGTVELAIVLAIPDSLDNPDQWSLQKTLNSEQIEALMLASIDEVNAVWENHGVQFVVSDVVRSQHPVNVSSETSLDQFNAQSEIAGIAVYPVNGLDTGSEVLGGFGVKDIDGCKPLILFDIAAGAFVLAHEFGHVVGLSHKDHIEGNLMQHITTGTEITSEQSVNAWDTAREYSSRCGF